ncbi:DUF1127 domain-containing protein [Pseudomonas oligotrophica]|uniref:DUF1127 domain-containing protein n=1 Tax=Pseudomonas oligotrophica TaxID=2912055 RepID=UPI001F25E98D|nr:DUF1127 domain-containing protein [Pseudomonas oligotrophica]MCF7202239.1 DUF1127 domain-containing protein [Pseudomonas oligotrophica]
MNRQRLHPLVPLRQLAALDLPRLSVRPLLARLRHWRTLARQRRQLAALDLHALKDIGLSRADVEREISRPFWDDRA